MVAARRGNVEMKLEISVVQFVINNSPKEFLVLIIIIKNEIMSYNEKQIYHHE